METWEAERAFEQCSPGVAALTVRYPRNIGIEGKSSTAYATAFIVSDNPLLLLTNKHVLTCAGLAQVQAFFPGRARQDRVRLRLKYIDPIHDFALCSVESRHTDHTLFDPDYPPTVLELDSNPVHRRLPVLSIGAMKGHKLEKAGGHVTSSEVNPPNGMDFNIWQIEATDKSTRGFSGGPVLNKNGKVIAIVASNYKTSSFHLPAAVIKPILQRLCAGQKVSRGTLHLAVECKRTNRDKDGLTTEATRMMITVTKHLADGDIKSGDEIVKLKGKEVSGLLQMEEILNSNCGKEINVELIRSVGKNQRERLKLKRKVEDLTSYSIQQLLEFSDAMLHPPEYNVLLFYNIPAYYAKSLFVSHQGYLFKNFHIPKHCLITHIGKVNLLKEDEENLSPCERFVKSLRECVQRGERMINICFELLGKRKMFRRSVVLQRRWFPTVLYSLDHKNKWRRFIQSLTPTGEALQDSFIKVDKEISVLKQGADNTSDSQENEIKRLLSLLVHVRFVQPFNLDGNRNSDNFISQCAGVIVDSKRGLIVCERYLVNSALGDCIVTIDGRKSVIGRVVLVHPTHMFSVIKLKTSDLAEKRISLPYVKLNDILSRGGSDIGEELTYYGLTLKHSKIRLEKVVITTKENINRKNNVKFAPKNASYFTTTLTASSQGIGGFYYSESKNQIAGFHVHFLSLSTFCGIQAFGIRSAIVQLLSNKMQTITILPLTLDFPLLADINISHALEETTELQLFEKLGDFHRTVLSIGEHFKQPLDSSNKASESLSNCETGDVIVAINKETVVGLRALGKAVSVDQEVHNLDVVTQEGILKTRELRLLNYPAIEIDEIIIISGAVFHKPSLHLLNSVHSESGLQAAAVISQVFPGSPAADYIVMPTTGECLYVTKIGDSRLYNWDHFVISVKEILKTISDGNPKEYIRMHISDRYLDSSEAVELDIRRSVLMFWAPRQIRRDMKSLSWTGKELVNINVKNRSSVGGTQSRSVSKSKSRRKSKAVKLSAKILKKLTRNNDV